jgi:glutathione synthase/RimK-type ligase-like ATP-grasp enzyme
VTTVVVLTAPRRGAHRGGPSARYRPGTGHPLAEALLDYGHDPVLWWDAPDGPLISCEPGLVLLRSLNGPQYNRARDFERAGVRVINRVEPHVAAADKCFQAERFAQHGIAHPPPLLRSGAFVGRAVAKPRRGSGGDAVREVKLPSDWGSVELDELVQPFVDVIEDYRAVVVGGEAVSWTRRYPAPNDFRTNLAKGATAEEADPPSRDAVDLALGAVAALELEIAGVDLVVSEHGPLVLEVNAATTLYGPSPSATLAIAAATARYIDHVLTKS